MKELSEKLQELSLSRRESEIYLALLVNKELTAPEVAKITSVTRTKSYEILQNLVKKRVCNENYKNGTKVFSSVEPNIAIQNILSVYENELSIKKQLANQLKADLIKLYKQREDKDYPLEYVEVLTDATQIRERWIEILQKTKRELVMFTKPPYSISFEDNLKYELSLIKKKKVTFKSLYEFNTIKTSEAMNKFVTFLEAYEKIGEEIRIVQELPMKLVISDDTITMLAMNDKISLNGSITTIIVNHSSFASALKNSFESYWIKAMPFKEFKKDFENILLNFKI